MNLKTPSLNKKDISIASTKNFFPPKKTNKEIREKIILSVKTSEQGHFLACKNKTKIFFFFYIYIYILFFASKVTNTHTTSQGKQSTVFGNYP